MALDSNSPGEERGASGGSERLGAMGLKLVGDRGAAAGPAGAASTPAQAAGPSTDEKSKPGVGPTPVRRGARKPGRQLPLWLFVALLVLFLVAYGYQSHQASQFEAEVARLETSLAQAESRLESHRTHLLEIRGGVHDLASRLESLRVLIDRDPTAPVESPATADSSESSAALTVPAPPGRPAQR